jgi:uncharacterized protein YciI
MSSLASILDDDGTTDFTALLPATVESEEQCVACRQIGGDRRLRGLCKYCYHSRPALRSCYSTTGKKLCDLPSAEPDVGPSADLFAPPPIAPRGDWWSNDEADDEAVRPRPLKRQHRNRMTPAQQAAQDHEDEQAVLAAVDLLVQQGLYTADDGTRAAGVRAIARVSELADPLVIEIADRLVAEGSLESIAVRYVRPGIRARGVRRPAPRS